MTQGVVPPPPPLPPLQVVGVTAYGTTGNATSIPPSIAVLPAGALLRGSIMGRNALGQFVLKTEKGDLALKTDVIFKRGAELVIRMEKAHNETLARIISVDGKSFAKYVESMSQQLPEEDSIAENAFTRQQAAPPPLEEEIPLPGKPVLPQPTLPTGTSNVSARMTAIMLSALPQGSDALKSLPPQVAQMLTQTVAGTQLAVKITQIVLPTAIAPATGTTPQQAAAIPLPLTTPSTSLPLLPETPAPVPTLPSPQPAVLPILPQTALPQLPPIPASAALPVETTLPLATPGASVTINANTSPIPPVSGSIALPPVAPAPAAVTVTTNAELPSPTPVPTALTPAVTEISAPAANASPLSASPASATPLPTAPSPVPIAEASAPPAPVSTSASQAAAQTLAATTASLPMTEDSKPLSVPVQTVVASSSGTAAPPMTRPVITATVLEGSASTGLTLHSPLGALRLLSPNPLPPGTQVHFEIEYLQAPTAPASLPGAPAPSKASAALEELQNLLLPTAAPSASLEMPLPFAPHLLPHPGRDMTTELVFLMSALKGGDIRKWLGEENIRKLEAKDADLLKQVTAEFAGMRTRLGEDGDPSVTRWTMYQLPIATQAGVVEPIRFYHREQGERDNESQEKKSESGQHFIVEIQFTRLGRLQLDGFIKKEKGAKQRFDLIIRSEHLLESDLKQGIREIFQNSGELAGFEGGISFQEGRDTLFALPRPSTLTSSGGGSQSIVV